jgi:tetratricopeptide (TPR) repeat protein
MPLYMAKEQYAKARHHFEQALKLNPDYALLRVRDYTTIWSKLGKHRSVHRGWFRLDHDECHGKLILRGTFKALCW